MAKKTIVVKYKKGLHWRNKHTSDGLNDDITLEQIFTENQSNMSRLELTTYEKYLDSN